MRRRRSSCRSSYFNALISTPSLLSIPYVFLLPSRRPLRCFRLITGSTVTPRQTWPFSVVRAVCTNCRMMLIRRCGSASTCLTVRPHVRRHHRHRHPCPIQTTLATPTARTKMSRPLLKQCWCTPASRQQLFCSSAAFADCLHSCTI